MLKATSNIQHNGQDFKAGDVLPQMSEKQAQILLDAGVAQDMDVEAKKPETKVAAKKPSADKTVAAKTPEKPKKTVEKDDSDDENAPAPKPNFANWEKPRLVKYAERIGVDVDESMLQEEIVEKLNAHLDARPGTDNATITPPVAPTE